ncbi:MAG TPA: hypothetical protein VF556_04370 [Pyrinomonadaceae bacterium]
MRSGKRQNRECGDAARRGRGENFRSVNIRSVLIFLLLTGVSFVFGCQPNRAIINSQRNVQTQPANAPERVVNSYERDLETMRTADFDTIFVIRRKDGAALDADDKRFIKMSSPPETNRFIVTDGEKAVIAGSKFKFPEENLKILQERFAVENFSKPIEEQSPANTNTNANAAPK